MQIHWSWPKSIDNTHIRFTYTEICSIDRYILILPTKRTCLSNGFFYMYMNILGHMFHKIYRPYHIRDSFHINTTCIMYIRWNEAHFRHHKCVRCLRVHLSVIVMARTHTLLSFNLVHHCSSAPIVQTILSIRSSHHNSSITLSLVQYRFSTNHFCSISNFTIKISNTNKKT